MIICMYGKLLCMKGYHLIGLPVGLHEAGRAANLLVPGEDRYEAACKGQQLGVLIQAIWATAI